MKLVKVKKRDDESNDKKKLKQSLEQAWKSLKSSHNIIRYSKDSALQKYEKDIFEITRQTQEIIDGLED